MVVKYNIMLVLKSTTCICILYKVYIVVVWQWIRRNTEADVFQLFLYFSHTT